MSGNGGPLPRLQVNPDDTAEPTSNGGSPWVPTEDFSSYCRGELTDSLTDALVALYRGGPNRPSEALDFLLDAFASDSLGQKVRPGMRPPHRVKEEFLRYVEASGFPRIFSKALSSLHKSYVNGDTSMAAPAFVREMMIVSRQKRLERLRERSDSRTGKSPVQLGMGSGGKTARSLFTTPGAEQQQGAESPTTTTTTFPATSTPNTQVADKDENGNEVNSENPGVAQSSPKDEEKREETEKETSEAVEKEDSKASTALKEKEDYSAGVKVNGDASGEEGSKEAGEEAGGQDN